MNEAIRRAIEGGYQIIMNTKYGRKVEYFPEYQEPEKIVLNPLFWRAIGKAEGWPEKHTAYLGWKNRWHDFIDHLADGGTPDTFFAALFTKGDQK